VRPLNPLNLQTTQNAYCKTQHNAHNVQNGLDPKVQSQPPQNRLLNPVFAVRWTSLPPLKDWRLAKRSGGHQARFEVEMAKTADAAARRHHPSQQQGGLGDQPGVDARGGGGREGANAMGPLVESWNAEELSFQDLTFLPSPRYRNGVVNNNTAGQAQREGQGKEGDAVSVAAAADSSATNKSNSDAAPPLSSQSLSPPAPPEEPGSFGDALRAAPSSSSSSLTQGRGEDEDRVHIDSDAASSNNSRQGDQGLGGMGVPRRSKGRRIRALSPERMILPNEWRVKNE
jgi:hypothetical protein